MKRIGLPSEESAACRDAILRAGVWELGDYVFASGKKANNKLDMERLLTRPELAAPVLRAMGKLVMRHEPDLLWGPPQGGQDFADELGELLELPVAHLEKVDVKPGHKTFRYATPRDRQLAEGALCAVGVDDATTEFTTFAGALLLDPLGEKTHGLVGGWRRGSPETERNLGGVPIDWVVEQHLPNMITEDHPFFQKFGHLAVRQGEYE